MRKLFVVLAVLALTSCVLAETPASYGIALTTGGDTLNLRCSYSVYEKAEVDFVGLKLTGFSINLDGLFATESSCFGGGISARAEKTSIKPLDMFMASAHIDGFGAGLLFREWPIKIDEADLVIYAVSNF